MSPLFPPSPLTPLFRMAAAAVLAVTAFGASAPAAKEDPVFARPWDRLRYRRSKMAHAIYDW